MGFRGLKIKVEDKGVLEVKRGLGLMALVVHSSGPANSRKYAREPAQQQLQYKNNMLLFVAAARRW